MAKTNEKCQAGCPHPREAHRGLLHDPRCQPCFNKAMNTLADAEQTTAIHASYHPFETIASLRTRIAELEGERDELRGLIEASDAGPLFERLDNQHLRIAELELELSTARGHAAYNKQKYQSQYSEAARLQEALALTESERLTERASIARHIDGKFAIRGDGQIIKKSSGEIVPEDEPLVLMRGRDRLMVATLGHYRRLCVLDGCNDYHLGLVDELINKFTAYAADPRHMKQPGVTRGAAWNPDEDSAARGAKEKG